jgi:hypothetical protein
VLRQQRVKGLDCPDLDQVIQLLAGIPEVLAEAAVHRYPASAQLIVDQGLEHGGAAAAAGAGLGAALDVRQRTTAAVNPGDVVIVPPFWAHSTISADINMPLTFGAWCDRQYGFEYDAVRAHKGLARFPVIAPSGEIEWHKNPHYEDCELIVKSPERYTQLGLESGKPIYTQFEENPRKFEFVPSPQLVKEAWTHFIP